MELYIYTKYVKTIKNVLTHRKYCVTICIQYKCNICCALWAEHIGSRSTKRRGDSPPFFCGDSMNELSIFVDESGDFGTYSEHSPYYLFSLVLHDQKNPIMDEVGKLDRKMVELGFDSHAIHTGPIIRNENYYKKFSPHQRKLLLNDLLLFTRKVDIKYHVVSVSKKESRNGKALVDRLSKQLSGFLNDHLEFFQSYDTIIVYYDYGQSEITTILTSVFNALFCTVEFRHVKPTDYKLFQVADMICTLELSKLNFDNNRASKSEMNFYESRRKFKDFYYKTINRKKM